MLLRAARAWPGLTLLVVPLWSIAATHGAPPAAASGPDVKAAIGLCVSRIDDVPTGLPALEKRCPGLPAALQAAEVRSLIISSSRNRLDRRSLSQLQELLHSPMGPAPSVSKLAPFLHGLQAGATAPRSWWHRLWDWLLERLDHKRQQESPNPWLRQVAQLLVHAQWLWTAIIWGALIALPIVVAIVVVREVRAMGGRSADEPVAGEERTASGLSHSRLALLRQVPLGQRPAQLFAMLIARLVAAGRLPPDRSLTHREVVRRALLDDADQRHLIESLARLAERQLYSGLETTADGTEELLARGEDLYTTGLARAGVE